MTKRRILMVLDSSMLLSFVILMSWRLSGVTAHEWIGLVLIGVILSHLLVHWGWVESNIARVMRRERRGRIAPLLLNTALFVAMGTTLISGVVISKVALPNALSPGQYVQWHGLHESAATFTLFIVGLHLALNWERIRGGTQRFFGARRRVAPMDLQPRRMPVRVLIRRAASVVLVSTVLIGMVWAKSRILPSHPQVLMMFPDGHSALVEPPIEITRVQAGSTSPSLSRGGARLLLSVFMLSIAMLIGRRVLRLRLHGSRADREATSTDKPSGRTASVVQPTRSSV